MEELKDCWCGARFRDTPTGAPGNRRRTALGKLAAHYKRFSNVGLILAFCMPLWIWNMVRHGVEIDPWPRVGIVLFGMLYCVIASVMDHWLYKGISRIDVATMPVSEVCRLAFYYRKKHFQFMAILIPLAVIFITCLGLVLPFDKWFIFGMSGGAFVGVLIGLRQFRIFMSEYREITNGDAN